MENTPLPVDEVAAAKTLIRQISEIASRKIPSLSGRIPADLNVGMVVVHLACLAVAEQWPEDRDLRAIRRGLIVQRERGRPWIPLEEPAVE